MDENVAVEVASGPVASSQRIVAIDALRGFAILGILIMNIQSFSMISAAYINPNAYGDFTGWNRCVWILSHIFADSKFMTIFAMLFGAGIVLMTGKIEARGESARRFHYRRTMWLIVIGLLHAYLLWYGDILFTYGLCALIVYLFRKLPPQTLLVLGLASLAFASLLFIFFGFSIRFWPPEAISNSMENWKPGLERVAWELEIYRSGWLDQMKDRVTRSIFMQTFLFIIDSGWRAGGLMLIGMAFFKWGIISGMRSRKFYAALIAVGGGVGLPLVAGGIHKNFEAGWKMEYSMFYGVQFNYWGSLFVSSAYIGLLMLVSRSLIFQRLTGILTAVGRMALTNYLAQTIICTTLFYGHGLGWFGRMERMYHPLIIVSVTILQLLWSPWWLRRFRFGPAEWLWRSLTYGRLQPMRLP